MFYNFLIYYDAYCLIFEDARYQINKVIFYS